VLAYHGNLPWAKGGFLGVDAFFVLSGYLITSLLLLEWRERGKISPIAFWSRRARRLLPALFLMLVGVAFYAVKFARPQELSNIRSDALATICYVANWRPVFSGQSYFDQFNIPSPLKHTWSLGIEEQYYVVWPLLLLLVFKLKRVTLSKLMLGTITAACCSALLMALLYHPGTDPSRVYYGTDTRAQSLLIGATLAVLLLRLGPIENRFAAPALQGAGLAFAGIVAIIWLRTTESSDLLYRGGFFFLAACVAVVIAASVQPKAGPIGKLLSLPPLRALGLISYGVYLWHWPIFLMLTPGRVHLGLYELFALRVGVTLAVSTVSYHLLEMPIRRGAFRGRKITWSFAPAGAACLAVALVVVTRGAVSPAGAFNLGQPADAPMPTVEASSQAPIRVMVLGESVAMLLDPGLSDVAGQSNIVVWNRAAVGCGFLDLEIWHDGQGNLSKDVAKQCTEWHKAWQQDVNDFEPDVVLMAFGVWDSEDIQTSNGKLLAGTPEWNAYVHDGLEMRFATLTSQGAKLMLATFPYVSPGLWSLTSNGQQTIDDSARRMDDLNAVYRGFAAEHPGQVFLVDLNGFADPEGKYTDLYIDGVRMREDGVHFTTQGSYVVARWLVPQIVAAADATGPTG